MIRLDKKLVDDLIRLTMKYYEIGNIDYLPSMNEIRRVLEESTSWLNIDLIEDLAKYTQRSGKGTYDDIYNALAAFGIIVEEPEIRICNYCNNEIDLDKEEHFHSTQYNYMHRSCGDKLLYFKEIWWTKGFNYYNAFDMRLDGEVDEFWKLEEKE